MIVFALRDFLDHFGSAAPVELCNVYEYAFVGNIKENIIW